MVSAQLPRLVYLFKYCHPPLVQLLGSPGVVTACSTQLFQPSIWAASLPLYRSPFLPRLTTPSTTLLTKFPRCGNNHLQHVRPFCCHRVFGMESLTGIRETPIYMFISVNVVVCGWPTYIKRVPLVDGRAPCSSDSFISLDAAR